MVFGNQLLGGFLISKLLSYPLYLILKDIRETFDEDEGE